MIEADDGMTKAGKKALPGILGQGPTHKMMGKRGSDSHQHQ
jgi:hypothetical protein